MRDIVVKKYTGDRALQRGLNDMAKKGYVVDQQASRKALYSAAAGVFTRKQVHTVTFRKQGSPAPVTPALAAPATGAPTRPAPEADLIDQLERLGRLRDSGVLTTEEFEAQKARLLADTSAPAATGDAEGSWDVVFAGLNRGTSEIQAIKSVCDVAGLDLVTAKRIIDDAGGGPTVLRSGIKQADAASLKRTLENAGLVVEMRRGSSG